MPKSFAERYFALVKIHDEQRQTEADLCTALQTLLDASRNIPCSQADYDRLVEAHEAADNLLHPKGTYDGTKPESG